MLLRRSHLKQKNSESENASISKSRGGSIKQTLFFADPIPSTPPVETYFSPEKKKKYICGVVNHYFECTPQRDRPATQHIKPRLHQSMHQSFTGGDWGKKDAKHEERMSASIKAPITAPITSITAPITAIAPAITANPQNSKIFQRSSKRRLIQTTKHFDVIQSPLQCQKIFHSRHLLKKQLRLIRHCGFPSPYKQEQGDTLIYRHDIPFLKDELYSLVRSACGEYLMIPTSKYYDLFANENQSLKTLIIELCRGLKEECASNAIRLNNIYQVGEREFILKDYSTAGYLERIPLSGRNPLQIEHPSIISQQNMLYLAPEMQSECTHAPSSQIWSIGCLVLQLVTFVPLWVGTMKIKGDPVRRRGLFGGGGTHGGMHGGVPLVHRLRMIINKLDRILKRKVIIAEKIIEVDERVIKVVKGMLQIDPTHRMTAQDVISTLEG